MELFIVLLESEYCPSDVLGVFDTLGSAEEFSSDIEVSPISAVQIQRVYLNEPVDLDSQEWIE